MNCDSVGRLLSETPVSARLPEDVTRHLKECPRCLNAARALDPSASWESPTPVQLEKIEQALLSDLRPVRPLAHPFYRFGALILTFASAAAAGVWWLGTAGLFEMSRLQAGVILSALATAALLLTYTLAQQMAPGARNFAPRLLPLAIPAALLILIPVLFPFENEANFWGNALSCIVPGALIAALTALPLWLVLRRGAILFPALTGAAAGLLAGLAAATALEIRCPNLDAWHILASHAGPVVLSAAAGWSLGSYNERR